MAKQQGWIRLYRKTRDNPLWRKPLHPAMAWIDILMEVQHSEEPQKVMLGMQMLTCNQGESLKSLQTWASRWGWSRSKTARFVRLLASERMVVVKSERITTRLSVVNYAHYNDPRNADDTQMECKRNANETQADTDKNVKNEKNEKDTAMRVTPPMDMSPAPGAAAGMAWHKDYPELAVMWADASGAISPHPVFQTKMCEALNGGVTLEEAKVVFAKVRADIEAWDLRKALFAYHYKVKRERKAEAATVAAAEKRKAQAAAREPITPEQKAEWLEQRRNLGKAVAARTDTADKAGRQEGA